MSNEYRYTADARRVGMKDVFAGFCLVGVPGGLIWLFVLSKDFSPGVVIWGLVLLIFMAAGVFFVGVGLMRVFAGGEWRISVVDGAVRWETPWAAEHAFAYAVGDIRCLERRIRTRTRKDGSVKTKVRYYLCGNDGTDHQLSKQSGVDLDEFVAVLTRQGVALDEVAVERFR